MSDPVDPATVEVVRNYLTSAAEEMMRTLIRTAPATIVYEIRDFGISIYDADLNLIADAPGLTMFLGANDFAIENAVEHVGVENFEPDDVLLMNYPYMNASHSQDVCVFAPVFVDGELVGYSTCRAHWVDIGAKDPGYVLDSTDVHQEGILFPPVKIHEAGELDEDLLAIIRANSRLPNVVVGELQSQISTLKTGEERVRELHERYGTSTVKAAIDQVLAHGERKAREAVEALPDGTWSATDYSDGPTTREGGEMIRRHVEVTVSGSEFSVDFAGSSDEVAMPFNVARGLTETAARLCFKVVTTPEASSNAGHYEPLSVHVPEGNVFNASYPSPTFIFWTAMGAVEVIFEALAKGMPERLAASSGGDVPNIRVFGTDESTGRTFIQACNDGQGWGATAEHDGESGLNHITESLIQSNPVEVMENKAPVLRIDRFELRQDSGGAGEQRGGLGLRRDYRFTDEGNALTVNQKTRDEGWGIDGGKPGARGGVVLNLDVDDDWRDRVDVITDNADLYPDAGPDEKWVGMMRGRFRPGEVVSNRTGGGGGYGDPFDRDPEAVREDVVDGYVSREMAREEYGVAVTADGEIDRGETERLRSQ